MERKGVAPTTNEKHVISMHTAHGIVLSHTLASERANNGTSSLHYCERVRCSRGQQTDDNHRKKKQPLIRLLNCICERCKFVKMLCTVLASLSVTRVYLESRSWILRYPGDLVLKSVSSMLSTGCKSTLSKIQVA
jgi:hypothetical protein